MPLRPLSMRTQLWRQWQLLPSSSTISELLGRIDASLPRALITPIHESHGGRVTSVEVGRNYVIFQPKVRVFAIGNVMIDSGPSYSYSSSIKPFFESNNITKLFLTHHHEDHSGCVGRLLADFPHLRIFCGSETAAIMKNATPPHVFPMQLYEHALYGRPSVVRKSDHDRIHVLKEFEEFGSEELNSSFLLKSPGHSIDHTCLVVEDNVFLGDVFISDSTFFFRADEDIGKIISSLEKILALENEKKGKFKFHCAHSPTLVTVEMLGNKLSYLKSFSSKCQKLHHNDSKSPEAIAKILFPRIYTIANLPLRIGFALCGGDVSPLNMVRSVLAGSGVERREIVNLINNSGRMQ